MWRFARAEDDEAVVALCLRLYEEDPGTVEMTAPKVRRTLARLRAEPSRGQALVLEIDRAVRGYALLISFWSNELGGDDCTLDEVYVSPPYRSRGHATALVELLAARGPFSPDAVAIDLEVSPGNVRARQLYERLGFAAVRNTYMRRRLQS